MARINNNPSSNEARYLKIESAWATLAPGASFGGMTLDQFRSAIRPSKEARVEVARIEDEMRGALIVRDNSDTTSMTQCDMAVKGVVADPTFGDDSALYEAMGYVRKSQRKSGLTRKSGDAKAK